jgi:hypothetical protein
MQAPAQRTWEPIRAPGPQGGASPLISHRLQPEIAGAGMWRERVDQHNTGSMQFERIERVIAERDEPADGCR